MFCFVFFSFVIRVNSEGVRRRVVFWLLSLPSTCKVYVKDNSVYITARALRVEAADQTCDLTLSQKADKALIGPNTEPTTLCVT